ncbi:Gfo/Idh/MocA family oxidoreductase [Sphingomonas sp. HITSZ_GF]|uniref:Gfo/Idh/MocA family protein n=1 Tax=Sphingomonas sp. HITSZ_GF TaxID=3037247 RepID=UPI00240DC407|nr:Gfo/Idh/MocA family oxidoreductase [Sphingomonas sp. HITSZ_GF]MDG2535075.1 Gfo/Idh/MocA family oxidoreductase [Sphingomonas sp. HITSZ_GF]
MGTRREMLGAIGAGLAAGALPLPAWAQGKRKLGYAIVGLGNYATNQILPRIAECEFAELKALVSGTPAKLEKFGAQYGVPRTHWYDYQSYDRIKDNPDIDLVYVVLPNSMHAEYSIRASRAGKHVLCEKPMAVSSTEAEAMIAAAAGAKRKLMIGYRCHFEPYNLHAVSLVKSGFVGRPTLITAEHGFYAQPGQWRLDRPYSGGGSLMDIGIYSLNAARYLAGEEPVLISAMEFTDKSDPRFRTVEDRIDWQMQFPSGLIANCVSSYSSGHNAYRVTGTKGWVGMEPATPYQGHQMWTRANGKTEQVSLPAPAKNQFVAQLDHLAESVLTGIPLRASGEEGLRDMRLIEAIYRSAREGRAIKLA